MKFYFAIAAALALLLATQTPIFGDHTGQVGLISAAVLAVLIWRALPGGKAAAPAGRIVTGHSHGTVRKFIARHEGGHAVAAKKLGGYVKSAAMSDNGGYVDAHLPKDAVKYVAFYAAGREAVGSGRGCSDDDAAIRAVLRSVPSKDRGQVRRDGERLARRIVSNNRGEINRFADRLNRNGRA